MHISAKKVGISVSYDGPNGGLIIIIICKTSFVKIICNSNSVCK